jgi:hypothetical protein
MIVTHVVNDSSAMAIKIRSYRLGLIAITIGTPRAFKKLAGIR